MKSPIPEGRVMQESGWALTSVIYDDRMPVYRVFYVQHNCAHGQTLSYKAENGEGWNQDAGRLSYIVCNNCGKHCPKNIFEKYLFLRAMSV